LIEIEPGESDALARTLSDRTTTRLATGGKELVFGPYYAEAAAFVPVTGDVVVVFGYDGDQLAAMPDEALQTAATMAADAVTQVTPAKRLADELEELEAVDRKSVV